MARWFNQSDTIGIASIGLHIPSLALPLEELARIRHVDPDKHLKGLGCQQMAVCPEGYKLDDLAVEAAQRALSRWEDDKSQIGLIAVANALCHVKAGQRIAAFSYGSGCGAELLTLNAGPQCHLAPWEKDMQQDLAERKMINAHLYEELRAKDPNGKHGNYFPH